MKKAKIAAILVCTMTMSLFTGCNETQKVSKSNEEEYMYTGKFETLVEAEDSYINAGPILTDTKVYYVLGNYDEKTEKSTYEWCVKDRESGEQTKQVLEMDENEYMMDLTLGEDGNLYCIQVNYGDMENPDADFQPVYTMQQYSEEGKVLKDWPISEMIDLTNDYISDILINGEGIAYLTGDQALYAIDMEQNKLLFSLNQGWISGMCSAADGVYICSWENDMTVSHVSTKEQKVDKTVCTLSNTNSNKMITGKDGKIYMNTGNTLLAVDPEEGTSETLLNWLDSDINGDEVVNYEVMEDQSIQMVSVNYDENKIVCEQAVLKKTKVTPENQRIVLTYGTDYLSDQMRNQILRFNKTNGVYRIKIREYSTDVNEGEEDAQSRMMTELMGSNAPDIIELHNSNVSQLVRQNLLLDLLPYIENDEEIQMEDYLPSAMEAGKVDGKLYTIIPTVGVSTMIAKKSMVGDTSEWKFADLVEYIKNRPEGTEVLEYGTKSSVLNILLYHNMDAFIDWENVKCDFQSDAFRDILLLCNEFPNEIEENKEYDSLPVRIRENQMVLWSENISESAQIQVQNKLAQEEVVYLGLPYGDELKPILTYELALGITHNCSAPEGAWEFIRTALTEEGQTDHRMGWNFPTNLSALDKMLEEDMKKEFQTDENGKQTEVSKGGYGYEDGTQIEIYAISEEEAATAKKLLNEAVGVSGYDEKLIEIITEEANAYFQGQKSLEETMSIIQSRVSIYVDEK